MLIGTFKDSPMPLLDPAVYAAQLDSVVGKDSLCPSVTSVQ